MAKYEIKHSCGHTEWVELFGRSDERERRVAWLEQQECAECRAAKAGDLEGSAKQVAWAGDIMAKAMAEVEGDIERARHEGAPADMDANAVADAMAEALKDAAASHKSATWWIDNRFSAAKALRKEMLELTRAKLGM